MKFIDFFELFLLDESFKTHSNIKHRANSAANLLINICLKQLKLEVYDIVMGYARITADASLLPQIYKKFPSLEERMNVLLPKFEKLFDEVRKKPDSIKSLFFLYYISCYIEYNKEHTFLTAEKSLEEYSRKSNTWFDEKGIVLFTKQSDKKLFNDGKIDFEEFSRRGFLVENAKLRCRVGKEQGHFGKSIDQDGSEYYNLVITFPEVNFTNKKDQDKLPSVFVQKIENLLRRITDNTEFENFKKMLENTIKPTIAHELTHAWQFKMENKEEPTTSLNTDVILPMFPFSNQHRTTHTKVSVCY